jgi:putative membrane protein
MNAPELKLVDALAIDRTRMAAERTLMAWVRTSLSMISFGFGIYKFIQILQAESPATLLRAQAPRNVGLAFTGIGTIALVVASLQYVQHLKRLQPGRPFPRWDLALVVACVIALLGLLMFGSIARNAGPLG